MKKFYPLGIFLILLLAKCERDCDDPFHDKNNLTPEEWAPQNFQVENISITEKKLTWSYDDTNIEGFKLDRKRGNESWQLSYQIFTKETQGWMDTDISPAPETIYSYRLYAYEGIYRSSEKNVSVTADFPAPTDLLLEKLSEISYKLTWQDNSIGEEGFRIDRKVGEGDWTIGFGVLGENETTFVDTNLFVGKSSVNVEYKVYAFYKEFESDKVYANINAALTPPTDLTITQNTLTFVTLNWQDNSTGEEGFIIERKHGTGNWIEVATTTETSWQDNNFEMNTTVSYRVAAYVANYLSTSVESSFNSNLPGPEDLEITANSLTSASLNWIYSFTGHEGFKIDRKINQEEWEVNFAIVDAGQNTYSDNTINIRFNEYTYRVYSYVDAYESLSVEESILLELRMYLEGGFVFYLDGNGGGMVCAGSNQSSGVQWGCYGTYIGGTSKAVGTGANNTAIIVAGCAQSGIPAHICHNLVLNGYSDWFLPSQQEMTLMWEVLSNWGIGNLQGAYWSSSEYNSTLAFFWDFSSNVSFNYYKYNEFKVRAVRTF
jgi:hypothetical protein